MSSAKNMKVQWHIFLHLVHVFMHLLQHDVLASLFMHLCSDPAGGNDILAGMGRIQEKYYFQQDGLLDLVHHMGSVQRAEQGQGGARINSSTTEGVNGYFCRKDSSLGIY